MPGAKQEPEYEVFISYRRGVGDELARLLQRELHERGISAFLDRDLTRGVIDEKILRRIAESPTFLIILTPNSLERCVNEEDWLRKEICQAISSERNIIPLYVDSFQFTPEIVKSLDPVTRELSRYQAVEYSRFHFKSTMDHIVKIVEEDRTERKTAQDEFTDNTSKPPTVRELWKWAGRWRHMGISIVISLLLIVVFSSFFRPGYRDLLALGFQATVIGIVAVSVSTMRINLREHTQARSIGMSQFHGYWMWVWITWFFYYISAAVYAFLTTINIVQPNWFWEPLFNSVNNLQSINILFCYFVLAGILRRMELSINLIVWTAFTCFAIANVVYSAVVYANHPGGMIYQPTGELIFRWISGGGAGISLAILVHCLQKQGLKAPLTVLTLLYFYAAIQVLYAINFLPLRQVAMLLSLPLKFVLFIFITWIIETGRVLFHFKREEKTES